MSMRKVDYPYAEGTEARYRHDLLNRDAVIAHLQERADRAELAVETLQTALRQLALAWKREADGYVMGSMLPVPVGDMNRASAEVTRRLATQVLALLPALELTP